jgi:hypothetical protein
MISDPDPTQGVPPDVVDHRATSILGVPPAATKGVILVEELRDIRWLGREGCDVRSVVHLDVGLVG